MRFAVQGCGDAMHHGGDAHGSLNLFGGEARISQDLFMAVDADAAAIDGRNRQAPEFEIHFVHAQQCVEKALKAMLAMRGAVYQRTHNLATLADTLADLGLKTPVDAEILLRLNPCAVNFRYDDMEIPTFSRQEVMTIARTILDWANAEAAASREG